jgi:hypothetical protein
MVIERFDPIGVSLILKFGIPKEDPEGIKP